ncbi:LAFE_0B02828g1_1 [Lachancea fermentati]|uniref:LAFE_0B02828g1_1 n=1 Tax=Lachancea fermentati TaxID=4955 RepID=A0A1G4M7Z2_LACFM|nr:LAFE_0B02828g1_1 [Lachancea fermentati]
MQSNILSVFNPPPERTLTEEETRDCIPCQIMSTMFSVGFGSYLLSGKAFQYSQKEKNKGISPQDFQKLNPAWWRYTLRTVGGCLIGFGFIRGSEGWLWNKNKEYNRF